jgi:PAS domain-containing protein
MPSVQAGIRKRIDDAAHRVTALKARLGEKVEPATLVRIVEELRTLVEQLEVAFADVGEALDEQSTRQEISAAAQRRTETLFRLAPTPCLGLDQEGAIIDINAAGATLLNVSARHIVGRSFPTFLDADRPAFLSAMWRVLEGHGVEHWHGRVRPRDRGPFEATLVLAADPPHHVLLLVQLAHDGAAVLPPLPHLADGGHSSTGSTDGDA